MNSLSRLLILITIFTLGLVGCAPAGDSPSPIPSDSTGLKNDKGLDYLNGGDPRVTKRVRDENLVEDTSTSNPGGSASIPKKPSTAPSTEAAAPATASIHKVATKVTKVLRERLIAFSLVRFDKGSNSASRMGKERFDISIYVRRDDGQYDQLIFRGKFDGTTNNLTFGPLNPDGFAQYQLKGNLEDRNDKVWGLWTITDTAKGETADIYYRAYKAKNTVAVSDEDPDVEKNFSEVLSELRSNTFGWVNNWVVAPKGRSFYLTDIVQTIRKDKMAGIFLSFSGESVRTGEKAQPDQPVQVSEKAKQNFEIQMVGDAGDKGKRMYEVTLKDPKKKETSRVLVSMDEENPEPIPPEYIVPEDKELETNIADSSETPEQGTVDEQATIPEQETSGEQVATADQKPESKPEAPTNDKSTANEPPPVQNGKGYFSYDLSSGKIKKIVADFNSNLSGKIDGFIKKFSKGNGKSAMVNFFKNAYYLRPLIETISNAYETPFAEITVVESHYLKGNFKNTEVNPTSTATGPYQIIDKTALALGLRASEGVKGRAKPSWDERHYFAPASCAAAKYVSDIAGGFMGGRDATLAILGYYTGPDTKLLKRVRRLAAYKGNRFVNLESHGAITKAQSDYVNKTIAVFKISSNPKGYGFKIEGGKRPPQNTVFPSQQIKSSKCREIVSSVPSV